MILKLPALFTDPIPSNFPPLEPKSAKYIENILWTSEPPKFPHLE